MRDQLFKSEFPELCDTNFRNILILKIKHKKL